MASRKAAGKKGPKKRAQRAHSNVFAMFDQDQIAEFKEAFNFVDQNRDGFIDKGCLISEVFFALAQISQKRWQITIQYPEHVFSVWIVLSVSIFCRNDELSSAMS